ncbi:ArdC family protein [Variovorax sp. RB3P1]|uniref:ArdC family protein n=1 Tax=Variovorax sp. RB3P1 TaxID=3443732 RepID=UPI003F44A1D9
MATKSWSKTKDKDYEIKDRHQEMTDRMLLKLEEAIKFETPWITANEMPHNPVTGTQYKGINALCLMSAGFPDSRYYTFNNIRELASKSDTPIHLIKGEKGLPVFKAMKVMFKEEGQEAGPDVPAEPGAVRSYWKQVYAGTVFNASQIEGLPPVVKQENKVVDHAEIEALAVALTARTNLQFQHGSGGAYYSPSKHMVNIQPKDHFKSTALYYSTLLHETGHATGNALGRDLTGKFGDKKYAFEELVAELSSYFMGADLKLPYDSSGHDNHAAYLKSWHKMLKEDKHIIFKAATQGSRAAEYNFEHLKEHKLELEQQKEWISNKVHQAHKEPEQKKTLTMSM